tara:strand:+ start:459 stop:668 length:210 start_codon:yes stop_codon:yes gene_type:complete
MIISELENGEQLACSSNWDSGTHLGFSMVREKKGEYGGQSLDKYLSKDQIAGLEMILLTYAKMYIEDNT